MKKERFALITVSDKSNLKPILDILKKNNIKIISSGGTFKRIRKLKYKCIEVSSFTGFNEILQGRVKTLHPKIHAGILFKRNNKSHLRDLKKIIMKKLILLLQIFIHLKRLLKRPLIIKKLLKILI